MSFDPARPHDSATIIAAELRDQFNALKALIDAQAAQIAAQAAQIASLQSQLNAAIAGTSNNSNAVGNLSLTINNNPPQQFEVQPIADKVDELINALRR